MIKAICFDLDGVYFLNGKSNFIKALEAYGVSEEDAKRVFLKSNEMNKEYKLGKMTDDEFWTWALQEWGLSMSVKEVIELLIKGYEINAKAAEYVKRVKAAGYKTVICSNNFPARIDGLQEHFQFLKDFDVVVLSYEVGIDKPNKGIFEEIIIRADVDPSEVIYSDDDESKMEGAKAIGINTYLYTDFDSFVKHLEELGVKV